MKYVTLLTLPLLASLPACTIDTLVDSGDDSSTKTQEPGLELYGGFISVGMSEAQATVCSSLGNLLNAYKSEYDELYPDQLPPPWLHFTGDAADLYVERAFLYQSQCEDWRRSIGWDECSTTGNPVVHIPPADCASQGLNYIKCLANDSLEEIGECESQVWDKACSTMASGRDFGPELGCEMTGSYHDEDTTESGALITYGIEIAQCPDGHTYGFRCPPPTSECALTCECEIDGIKSGTASFNDFTADVTFSETVWTACGFPPIP